MAKPKANIILKMETPSAPAKRSYQNVSSWVDDAGLRWYNWNEVVIPTTPRKQFSSPTGSPGNGPGSPTAIYSPRSRKAVKRQQSHRQKQSYVVPLLVFGMGAVFTWQMWKGQWYVEDFQINPTVGPPVEVLLTTGARRGDLVITDGEWWRLFSSSFTHSGFVSYAISTCGLLILGTDMEKEFGWWRILLIFMLGSIGGAATGLIFVPEGVALGSIAGMMALCGAELGGLIINWELEPSPFEESAAMLVWIGIVLAFGIMPLIDNWASAYGAILGVLLGISLLAREVPASSQTLLKDSHSRSFRLLGRITAGLMAVTIFGMATGMLFTHIDGAWCGDSCVNFTCKELPPGQAYPDKWWYCSTCRLYSFEFTYRADGSGFILCPDGKSEDFTGEPPLTKESSIQICEDLCTNFGFGYEARDLDDAITFNLSD